MWTRPIGTAERPADADRRMGPARLLAAHALRARATARGAAMIGASVTLHAAALHAVALAPAPGALELALCVVARRASSSSARVARGLARE